MRVLLTRARGEAERTAARLAERGHKAVIAPLTTICATQDPLPSGPWDAVIVTSARAASALGRLPDRDLPVFAVGQRTAEAARSAGSRQVHIAGGDALSLAALVRASLPPGSNLLHIAGRHRKAEPQAALAAAGFAVRIWEAYEARSASSLPDDLPPLLQAGRIDAALHFSRRSAAVLVDLCDRAGLRPSLEAILHVCLSADVCMALTGIDADRAIAAEPDEEALLAALEANGNRRGSPRSSG